MHLVDCVYNARSDDLSPKKEPSYNVSLEGQKRGYKWAEITGMTGHDLRRTFSTMVEKASGSADLAMSLLRDKTRGLNDRYINYSMDRLREALEKHSPLRLIFLVETGESRTLLSTSAAITHHAPYSSCLSASASGETSSSTNIETVPTELLSQLLDQLVALGETARMLRQSFMGNGQNTEQPTVLIQQHLNGGSRKDEQNSKKNAGA